MSATIDQDELARIGRVLHNLVPWRTTLPILTHVLIEAGPRGVLVTATDLDLWVTVPVEGEVAEPFAVAVPFRTLRDFIRTLPSGAVRISAANRRGVPSLLVEADADIRGEIEGLSAEEFPAAQRDMDTHELEISAADLWYLARTTGFAASREEARPILNGVQWETTEGRIRFCATNGHRLASTDVAVPTARPMPEMIVSPVAFRAARAVFPSTAILSVVRGGSWVRFEAGRARVVSRLIAGPYPNWREVVPKAFSRTAVLHRTTLLAAHERAVALAPRATRRVALHLGQTGPNEAWLSTQGLEGVYGERLTLEAPLDGEEVVVQWDAEYALELLRRIPTALVRLRVRAPDSALLFEPVGEDTPALTMLLMPLRSFGEDEEVPWAHLAERKVA